MVQCDARTPCSAAAAAGAGTAGEVHCSMLQCIAACCSALQRVAVHCSVLQCCSGLQGPPAAPLQQQLKCAVLCGNVLQCVAGVAVCYRGLLKRHRSSRSSMLQCVAVCCSVMQPPPASPPQQQVQAPLVECVAVCCSVLQCVARAPCSAAAAAGAGTAHAT